MGIPGEDIVSTAIDRFADGVMKKMDEDEERRDREFTYRMKELDFYKNSYEQEINAYLMTGLHCCRIRCSL